MPRRRCLDCGNHTTTGSRCPHCTARRQHHRNTNRPWYAGDWPRIRRQALEQQPWCTHCGATTDLTVDHIAPRTLTAGVQVLCRPCNSRKANRGG